MNTIFMSTLCVLFFVSFRRRLHSPCANENFRNAIERACVGPCFSYASFTFINASAFRKGRFFEVRHRLLILPFGFLRTQNTYCTNNNICNTNTNNVGTPLWPIYSIRLLSITYWRLLNCVSVRHYRGVPLSEDTALKKL